MIYVLGKTYVRAVKKIYISLYIYSKYEIFYIVYF